MIGHSKKAHENLRQREICLFTKINPIFDETMDSFLYEAFSNRFSSVAA